MEKPTGLRVQFYRDVAGEWRWTQYARNGKIRAASEQGFSAKDTALMNWLEGLSEAALINRDEQAYIKRHDSGEPTYTKLKLR